MATARGRRSTGAPTSSVRIARLIGDRPRVLVAALLLITIGLSLPMMFWEPEETASQSPVSEITIAQELAAERFADPVFDYFILVEAADGEMLDREPLLALLENSAAMRADPEISRFLVSQYDPTLNADVLGIWTIADTVDQLLVEYGVRGGLAAASEEQIDGVVGAVLDASDPDDWGLSTQTTRGDDGVWSTPALFVQVRADNEGLGGGGFLVTIGTDNLEKEHFARDLTAALRGDGGRLNVWAPASDVNLTSNEQGELAGPFIGLTIAAVLLVVGVAFQSYWAVAFAGAALGMLMIWMRGGANLIGFKSDQLLSTILPISMISFGIDSAFHGIGRVREQQRRGDEGRHAFVVGLGAVLGALALAGTSDAAAFLANTASGIESIVQFGLAAAIATFSAFVLLGVATPLMMALTEGRIGARTISRLGRTGDLFFSLVAASLATATVLVLVFVSAAQGLALLGLYFLVALLLPYAVARRGRGAEAQAHGTGHGSRRLGASVAKVAARPWLTIGVASLVTAAALWAALQLEVTFDVNDFFSPDSDFVVALDKTAEYLGERGGEPALVHVETDLAEPEALSALRLFSIRVAAADNNPFAVGTDGTVRADGGILDLVDDVDDFTAVEARAQLTDLYDEALQAGIDDPAGTELWGADDVATVLWRSEDSSTYATVLVYQIPDTRDQENVARAREILEPAAADLEQALRSVDPESDVVVTGSAIYRDDQLAAIRRAMLLALPIAIAACFAIAAVFMRSIRYAIVSVIPIILVVAWLYGLMYQTGYSINVVTSIIGAVSVGIGIDFSTHFTMRFLEEHRGGLVKPQAIAAAGTGTGSALLGSAVTSVAGFGILAFAPMPMFASYGLLTAIMIGLALIASLYVLPSLLAVVTRDGRGSTPGRRSSPIAADSSPVKIGLATDLSPPVAVRLLAVVENEFEAVEVAASDADVEALIERVAAGELDVAVVARWPATELPLVPGTTVVSLAHDEIVAVGGEGERDLPVASLVGGLLVAGPDHGAEAGVRGFVQAETHRSVLTRSVDDVVSGIRLAAMTGGWMVLARSRAAAVTERIRSLEPRIWMDIVMVANPARSADAELVDLAMAWSEALSQDANLSVNGV